MQYVHYLQTAVFSCSEKYVLWKALIENVVVDVLTIQLCQKNNIMLPFTLTALAMEGNFSARNISLFVEKSSKF